MLYMILCIDKPGAAELRAANRSAHLAYAESVGDRLVFGGPLLSDDGQAMVGSMLVLECDDRAGADAFVADDPYGKAGLFERVEIRPWRKVFPKA